MYRLLAVNFHGVINFCSPSWAMIFSVISSFAAILALFLGFYLEATLILICFQLCLFDDQGFASSIFSFDHASTGLCLLGYMCQILSIACNLLVAVISILTWAALWRLAWHWGRPLISVATFARRFASKCALTIDSNLS